MYWLAIFQLKDFTFPSLSDDPQSMEFSWFFGWYLDDWAADFFWQQCDFIDTLNLTMLHTVLLSVVQMKMNVLKSTPIQSHWSFWTIFGWLLDVWFFWQQCDFIDTLNPTMYHTVLLSVVKMKMNVLKNAPIPKSLVILDNFLDDFLGDC